MQVKRAKMGIAVYLTPDGALIEDGLTALTAEIQATRQEGVSNLVIDLQRVPFIDSSGLEFIVDLSNTLREDGGSLRLAGPDSICRDILTITRVDQMVPLYDDVESAGRSFL